MAKDKEAVTDRFAEMNTVLDECVADVQVKADAYLKNQKRIGDDKTPATAAALSEAQVKAMAKEAMNARWAAIVDATIASVVGQVKRG